MRIVFTGSHGTGKTTLVNELKKFDLFKDYYVNKSFNRLLSAELKHYKKAPEMNIINQSTILGFKSWEVLQYKNYIGDRAVIDTFGYINSNIDKNISEDEIKLLHKTFSPTINYYDYIFYIPVEFYIEDDNFRPTDRGYQKKVDEEIFKYLKKNKIKHYEITGCVKERIDKIMDIINGY